MWIAMTELFEHFHNFIALFERLEVFRFQIVFLDPLNSEAEIGCARYRFTPHLKEYVLIGLITKNCNQARRNQKSQFSPYIAAS